MALPAGRYGVTKNQLLKIKKLPMNTIKLIEELTEKFNLLGTAAFKNSTSVVTESSDLVESGAVYNAIQSGVDGIYSVMGKNGAKNRLFLTLAVLKANNTQGTWSNNVYTYNGLTFTVYLDASGYVNGIKITGTNTAQSGYTVFKLLHRPQNVTGMKLSGCPSGGSTHSYAINYTNSSTFAYWDSGNGTDTLTQFDYTQFPNSNIGILIEQGYACPEGGLMFYPMLRLASDTDPTYAEPSLTNVELTSGKCDNSVIAPVENGSTASQAYAVGEHFIRDGAFCTVIQAISSGGRLTEGTNYTSGDVAELLTRSSTFSLSDAFSAYAKVSDIGLAKYGNVVQIRLHTTSGSIEPNVWNVIGTLKDEYKPLIACYETALNANGEPVGWVRIKENGDIEIYCTGSANINCVLGATYITAK